MTKHFAQGRDLSKPLVEVPADARWYERLGLRVYSGYLWLIFGFCAFAIVVWILLVLIG